MYFRTIFVLVFFSSNCFAQNLVPNPSFENISSCNIITNELNCDFWFSPNICSPDNFHSCSANSFVDVPANSFGSQFARTGEGYSGFLSTGEFIEVKLTEKLKKNINYCVEFYVSLSDDSQYAIDNIECFLSTTPLYGDTLLDGDDSCDIILQAQIQNTLGNVITDKLNWVLVQGNFIGNDEEYITIGTFRTIQGINKIDTLSATAGYFGYYYVDDVSVYFCDDTTVYETNMRPNPNNGNFTLNYNLGEKLAGILKIYNSIGQIIFNENLIQNNGTLGLSLTLSSGIYIWSVETNDEVIKNDKFIVIK